MSEPFRDDAPRAPLVLWDADGLMALTGGCCNGAKDAADGLRSREQGARCIPPKTKKGAAIAGHALRHNCWQA